MKNPRVFVVTLNWNGKKHTLEFLDSIFKMNYPNFRAVVVDNGSRDGSQESIKKKFPSVVVIENGKNLGYCEGFNVGLRYALRNGADYVLVANNDIVVEKNLLTELVKIAIHDPNIGFVGPKIYFYDEPKTIQAVGGKISFWTGITKVGRGEVDYGQYDKIREVEYIDDCAMLVHRDVIEKVGGYDPDYFLYNEEADWCVRARAAGFKIVYTPKTRIWHKESMTSGGKKPPATVFYLTRNRILFMRKNAAARFPIFLLIFLFCIIPLQMLSYLAHGRTDLILPHLKGLHSAIVWLFTKRMLLYT